MLNRHSFYVLVILSFLFAACQKEPLITGSDYKTLGSSAHDLLSSSAYTSLRVEISYMSGYEPDAASLNNLTVFLQNYLNKPAGIQIVSHAVAPSGKTVLSLNDLVRIEQKNRTEFTAGSTMAVYILIADANYADSTDLAISYWNTSFCLFGKNIWQNSGGAGQVSRANLLSTLLQHEFGHLLGLVGQGSPQVRQHRDDANGAHCGNRSCLMYYTVETNTTNNFIPGLDADCITDLKANGSK